MKRSIFRNAVAFALAAVMLASAAGCSNSGSGSSSAASAAQSAAAPAQKTKIVFWHLWTGDEAKVINAAAAAYNKQSDKYEVQALSVPDSQKIMTAISAGNGPDVSDDFSSDVGKFAGSGILNPLDDYIKQTNYDVSDFIPAALQSCMMDGKTYGLPISINLEALYYNKTLLKKAGYSNPPETLEDMYDMAVKTTEVNKDGTLNVCGFPDFPTVYYLSNFTTAAGGGWYTKDDKPAPADDAGNTMALKLARDYRQKFGLANVVKFESGGKYLDPTDPFLTGKQTFRVDGSWMGKNIKETFKSDVDYGVTYIPYPKDKPELKGRGLMSSSMIYITSNSKNKDGAWDFISWFAGKEGQIQSTIANNGFPSRTSLLTNETFLKGYDVSFYVELAQNKNLTYNPNGPKNGEYDTMVNDQTELCMNLKQDIPTTLKNIHDKGASILG